MDIAAVVMTKDGSGLPEELLAEYGRGGESDITALVFTTRGRVDVQVNNKVTYCPSVKAFICKYPDKVIVIGE